MFITDEKTIGSLISAYVNDAIRASVTGAIYDTRTDREQREVWLSTYRLHAANADARMDTISTIDRTLAQAIYDAFCTLQAEAWKSAGKQLGAAGSPREIVAALGGDYSGVFGAVYGDIVRKVQDAVDHVIAGRVAGQEAA